MSERSSLVLATVATVVLALATAGSAAVLADGSGTPNGSTTPIADTFVHSDPAGTTASATHTVVVTLGDDVPAETANYDRVVVDYGDTPSADTSGVTATDIVRAGVDRRDELYRPGAGGGDDPGARIDRNLTVAAVAPSADGTALSVAFAGDLDLHPEDELVLVVESVENPAAAGNATVGVTVESGDTVLSGTDTVGYEPASGTATPAPDDGDGTTDTPTPSTTAAPTDAEDTACEP